MSEIDFEARLARMAAPVALRREGRAEPELWLCGHCDMPCVTEETARRHYPCAPRVCSCGAWIDPEGWPYTLCRPCKEAKDAAHEAARMDGAPRKVAYADYAGPGVFVDGEWLSDGDVEARLWDEDQARDDGEEPERAPLAVRAWGATEVRLVLDVDEILDRAHEHLTGNVDYGGCDPPEWVNEPELRAFLATWNAKQPVAHTEPDYETVVYLRGAP